jgi:hypothetical protein
MKNEAQEAAQAARRIAAANRPQKFWNGKRWITAEQGGR